MPASQDPRIPNPDPDSELDSWTRILGIKDGQNMVKVKFEIRIN